MSIQIANITFDSVRYDAEGDVLCTTAALRPR